MQVKVVDHVAGAAGVAVVIDVFRAFSVAACAFSRGAATVIPIASVDAARELKRLHPDWLLIGERHARALPGFDCGNSPSAQKFFDPACDWAPERDFDLCTRVDEFDFVLRVERPASHSLKRLRRIDVARIDQGIDVTA